MADGVVLQSPPVPFPTGITQAIGFDSKQTAVKRSNALRKTVDYTSGIIRILEVSPEFEIFYLYYVLKLCISVDACVYIAKK